MKVAMAQTNPVIGDFRRNGRIIRQYADRARTMGCDLVVFPELAISGYPPGDLLEKDDFIQNQLLEFDALVNSINGIGVLLGFCSRNSSQEGPRLLNSAALFENGVLLARIDKQLLPTYDVFDETRYFRPGRPCSPVSYKGHRLGITICEDIWNDDEGAPLFHYDTNPVADLAKQAPDLLINIAASPFHAGKQKFRMDLLKRIATRYSLPLIFTNQVGGNDTIIFDGLSAAITPQGTVTAQASDFIEDIVVYDTRSAVGDIHSVSSSETESILNALVTGTRDYIRKCGFSKAVIGSSGGIDSAVTAAIAVKALGPENVQTIFMPSVYTSAQNFTDTRELAANLGVSWTEIPIAPMYEAFINISDSFDMASPGIAEQNIQARIRGTILMAISNRDGSILLSTGNKSEMAVGYSTLYGDMCGGLAVIGDLPKKKVYELGNFFNSVKTVIPESILRKAPSAELAPNQTDQDDLPDYDTIDAVVKGYIEDHLGIDNLVAMGLDRETVTSLIVRINRNEYKRYQAPPILRVTSKAFGPGRRHPMAQQYLM